jgi:transposase
MIVERSLAMAKKRSKKRWKLTDEQWAKIEPLLPKLKKSKHGGRPWIDNRRVFEGILWVLRTGAPWEDVPKKYASGSTCWRRLRDWEEQDIWLDIWRAFLAELDKRGQLDWSECFADGSFASAKKGANASERPNGARERSGWWWSTAKVFLWETTWTRHPRRKSNLSKRRSKT